MQNTKINDRPQHVEAFSRVSLRADLTRSLSERGLVLSRTCGGALHHVGRLAIQFTNIHGPTALGRYIAGSAYGEIGK